MKPSTSLSTLIAFTIITDALFRGCTPDTQTQTTPSSQDNWTTSTPTPPSDMPEANPPSTEPSANSSQTSESTDTQSQSTDNNTSASTYKDNTYNEAVSYSSPAGNEDVTFTFNVKNGAIEAVDLKSDTTHPMSKKFQGLFITGIKQEIVGKKINEIGAFDHVNGSSLTAGAFNEAFQKLKTDAKA